MEHKAIGRRAVRLVYRQSTDRPTIQPHRPRPRGWRQRHLRAGCAPPWHTHPLSQTLIITAGCGRVQSWGGPIREVKPGDVVQFAPGEKHWHGAAPTTVMTHIAVPGISRRLACRMVGNVTNEQYQG